MPTGERVSLWVAVAARTGGESKRMLDDNSSVDVTGVTCYATNVYI